MGINFTWNNPFPLTSMIRQTDPDSPTMPRKAESSLPLFSAAHFKKFLYELTKIFFILKKFFLWPYIKETVFSVWKKLVIVTWKEIWWLNTLRFVRRSTILESKPELLEKVMLKSHHNGKIYYVNHYSLSVWNLSPIMRDNSSIHIILPNLLM